MLRGTAIERVLAFVAGTMGVLCVVFAVYLMLTPEWDSAKTLAIGTILGALMSLATAITGVLGVSYLERRKQNGSNDDSSS